MLELSDNAAELLRAWIGRSTWDSNHALDRARFYRFVRALWEDVRSDVNVLRLRARIIADAVALHDQKLPAMPNWTEEGITTALDKGRFVEDANAILGYLTYEAESQQ